MRSTHSITSSIPQARVVRKAGRLIAPPPAPRSRDHAALADAARTALVYAVGLWPLTAVVLLLCGLLIMAGNNGAP
ncbi:MAG: hypothetical protein ACRDMZ_20880 [Solirubrobacteraceae bacterium]